MIYLQRIAKTRRLQSQLRELWTNIAADLQLPRAPTGPQDLQLLISQQLDASWFAVPPRNSIT